MDTDKDTEETRQEMADDSEDAAEKSALFDQPLVQTGKRKRKSTELFSFQATKRGTEYTGGKGVRLGEIPFIDHSIGRFKPDQLKPLYRLCYDKAGTKSEIKRNLRDFSGFSSSEVIDRKRSSLEKMYVPALKTLCELLGLETSGKKEDIITRILEYLNEPSDLGKVPRKRKSSSGRPRKKSKPASESEDEKEELEDDVMEEEEQNEDSVMDTSQATSENGDTATTSDDKATNEEPSSKKEEPEKEEETQEQEKSDVPAEDSKESEAKEDMKDDANTTKDNNEGDTKEVESADSTKEVESADPKDSTNTIKQENTTSTEKKTNNATDSVVSAAVDTGKEE